MSTVVSEYTDGAWGKRREDVDASAEDAVADIRVNAEVVGEDKRSRGEWSEKGRVELGEWLSLLVLAKCSWETGVTEVSILSVGDVITAM